MAIGIFDIDNWKEIGATLSRNRTRTFLTGFGIFWGTAMLALLWGGAHGARGLMEAQFDGFSVNTMVVWSQSTALPYNGFKKGTSWDLTLSDLNEISRSVSGVKAVSGLANQWGQNIVYKDKHKTGMVKGLEPNAASIYTPIIYEGRFINEADVALQRKVCVVGRQLAGELFGQESPVGRDIHVNGIGYKVVGVAGDRSENINLNGRTDECISIPLPVFMQVYNCGEKVRGCALILADNDVKLSSIKPYIERILRRNHNIHPDDVKAIGSQDVSELFEMVGSLFSGIDFLALFIGVSTLIAGIIGIGNIMWVIVKERTQEIGIRRAIGAKPRDITMQILAEGCALTFIAGSMGICFAVLVLHVVDVGVDASRPLFQLPFAHALAIMSAFCLLGTAAGIIPALKAMRIKPIEAINDK